MVGTVALMLLLLEPVERLIGLGQELFGRPLVAASLVVGIPLVAVPQEVADKQSVSVPVQLQVALVGIPPVVALQEVADTQFAFGPVLSSVLGKTPPVAEVAQVIEQVVEPC